MPTAQVKIKRLFQGLASIRTTTIDICIKKGADLKIIHKDQPMIVSLEKLKAPDKFQIHKRIFKSKFNPDQTYELYDFPFRPEALIKAPGIKSDREQLDEMYVELKNSFDKITHKFVPEFGNMHHIDLLPLIKKIEKSLKKLKDYKASLSRAVTLASSIRTQIRQAEFLKNK